MGCLVIAVGDFKKKALAQYSARALHIVCVGYL